LFEALLQLGSAAFFLRKPLGRLRKGGEEAASPSGIYIASLEG
jgi:hypothetical protein